MTVTLILTAYLGALIGITIMGARARESGTDDYFLAGRRQSWIVTALTMMATFFSAAAVMGAPGWVYVHGIPFFLFALNIPFAASLIWIVGRRVHVLGKRHGLVTPSDLVCWRHPSRVLGVCVCAMGFLYVLPYIVLQIKAGGYLFEVASGGKVSEGWGATILALLTMTYLHLGGMRSVAWADVMQGSLLLATMFCGGFLIVWQLGGPSLFFSRVAEATGPDFITLPGLEGFWTIPMLATFTLVGAAGTMVSPGQWLRYNAAGSARDLKRAAMIFAIILPSSYLFGIMLVGLGGRVLFPDLEKPDQLFLLVIKNHLPLWLSTLFLVGIMAAAMSTADSNLHALSAIISKDIYKGILKRSATQGEVVAAGHVTIFATTMLALAIVLFVERLGMLQRISMVAMAFSLQILPVVVDVLYFHKGKTQAAIAGIVAGTLVLVLLAFVLPYKPGEGWGAPLNPWTFHYGFWAFAVNVSVFAGLSALLPAERRDAPAWAE